jgi:serine/threonine-protein kinase
MVCGNVMKSVLDPLAHKKGEEKSHKRAGDRRLATARAIARFSHPYLVEMRALSTDELEFEPELRGGVRLSDLSRERFSSGPAPLAFGLRILLDALSGLAAVHGASLGFAHGEVAPCNVVVGADGRARLVPVVAAHFLEGAPPGTDAAGFAAPERLRCDPFDHRADVFSVGVMLWEMITGRSFRGLPPEIITAWVIDGKVPDPVHPDDAPWVVKLAAVATRALAVQPDQRWPHVGVMGEEIENAAEGHIASVKEVRDLLTNGASSKPAPSPSSPSENPAWTPSLSPTAVSVPPSPIPPPPLPPSMVGLYATAPLVNESTPPPTRRAGKKRRRQSVIAWSTLLVAVVLLAVATREVLEGLASSRSVATAPPGPRLVSRKTAPLPPVSPAVPVPAASDVAPPPATPPAVPTATENAPATPATAAPTPTTSPVRSVPGRRIKRAPRKAAPPPAATAAPKTAPKGREDTFGI